MHVGVKKAVAEYLGKENLHAVVRELADVYALFTQQVDFANRGAVHALHDHDLLAAPIPMHFRHQ